MNSYNPQQPRDPKGVTTGGRWTGDGSKAVSAARKAINQERPQRPGQSPPIRSGLENAEIVSTIRQGDRVDFGDKGKFYVQGWRGDYFLVTNKRSERYVEDPIAMNLQGAIHFSDAKRILDEG